MATNKQKMKKYAPIAAAVVAGGLLLWWSRKASASGGGGALPPADDEPSGGGGDSSGGGGGPSGGGGQRRDAPPFPGQNRALEESVANIIYTEWMAYLSAAMVEHGNEEGPPTDDDYADAKAAMGIGRGRTVSSWLTDAVFYRMYPGVGQIPGEGSRGSGWQPYIDSWKRVYADMRSKQWTGG